jgi:hypothetical protein
MAAYPSANTRRPKSRRADELPAASTFVRFVLHAVCAFPISGIVGTAATNGLSPAGTGVQSLATVLDEPIRFAIANKRLVQIIYKAKLRLAEPHDYGLKNGTAKVLVYQLSGQSRTTVHGWKLLDVSKIDRLVVLGQTFRGSRMRPGQHHMVWDEVFARVQ